MILNARAVVLWRRRWAEADRLVCLYTESHGKLLARFIGADKPRAKLRALSEPFVSAEYRLIFSRRTDAIRVGGGALHETFPAIRGDWRRTVEALRLCELVSELTPERSPNPEKFFLLEAALRELEGAPKDWERIAPEFGARLLGLSGFGLEEGFEPGREGLWARVEAAVTAQTGRPLKSSLFRDRLEAAGRDFRPVEAAA